MDLVDFDREVFEKILDDFSEFLTGAAVHAIPMSALQRRQRHHAQRPHAVFRRAAAARVSRDRAGASRPDRRAVPLPGADGASARTTSSAAMPGRSCRAPSAPATRSPPGRPAARARVKRIVTFDGDLDMAFAPMSVTLTLDDEIDISRGDVLTRRSRAFVGQQFEAEVVWMDERPLDPGRVYLLKHGTRTVTAEVNHALVLNQIGTRAGLDRAAARVRPLRREPRHRQLHPDRSGDAVHLRRRDDHRSGARGRGHAAPRRRSPSGWRTSRGARRPTTKPSKPCARRSRRC